MNEQNADALEQINKIVWWIIASMAMIIFGISGWLVKDIYDGQKMLEKEMNTRAYNQAITDADMNSRINANDYRFKQIEEKLSQIQLDQKAILRQWSK